MNKILLAGATGYLGQYILKELLGQGFQTTIIVRNVAKLPSSLKKNDHLSIINAALTQATTLKGCCHDVDTVISTVGITKQRDGLTYMDVDYQANLNLLEEAKQNGVRKFVYVSVFKGEQFSNIKICAAKERFVAALKASGLDYCVIRPNGYFSDMAAFFKMAQKGRVFLFGNGQCHINPIHGADLAAVCVQAISSNNQEIAIGGPDVFSFNEIAQMAFSILQKKEKISHIPNRVGKLILWLLRHFSSSKIYGPFEFLMTVLTHEMVAAPSGLHHLEAFFKELKMNAAK